MADHEENLVGIRQQPPEASLNDKGDEVEQAIDKKSTLAAIFSLLFSIPALIGS